MDFWLFELWVFFFLRDQPKKKSLIIKNIQTNYKMFKSESPSTRIHDGIDLLATPDVNKLCTISGSYLTHAVDAHIQWSQSAPGAISHSRGHFFHSTFGVDTHQRARALLVVVRVPFYSLTIIRMIVVSWTLYSSEIQSVGTRLQWKQYMSNKVYKFT